jgi:hypothetical protein
MQKPASLAIANPVPSPEGSSHHGPAEAPKAAGMSDATVAAPMPLLSSDRASETEKTAIPARPGPGSGGLY